MTEYWKSTPKYRCDFCKCWIGDNKASRDFHERGKRHQEAVKEKIDRLKKQSFKDAIVEREMEDEMQKMEKAALAAFKKDLANNPELAAGYSAKLKPKEVKSEPNPAGAATSSRRSPSPPDDPNKELWYEALSGEGHTYYWSSITNLPTWDKPESYVSIAEQNGLPSSFSSSSSSHTKHKDKKKHSDKSSNKSSLSLQPIDDIQNRLLDAAYDGKVSFNRFGRIETTEAGDGSATVKTKEESQTKSPYGTWTTNKFEPVEEIDLQLPDVQYDEIPLPQFTMEEPEKVKHFKEKRVESLGNGSTETVAFKKRKFGAGSRNARQRGGDD